MVPVRTFEKLWFRFLLLKSYGSGSSSISRQLKANFSKTILEFFFAFLHKKRFYKEKVYKFPQIYCKMWMKKMLNEGNQIHNFISRSGSGTIINYGSGSDFLTSYGSGSTSQKVTVPVPVPQRCHKEKGKISLFWFTFINQFFYLFSLPVSCAFGFKVCKMC